MAKIKVSHNQLLLWHKQYQEFQNHYFAAIMHNQIKKYYKNNGNLIKHIQKKDAELLDEYMTFEEVEVQGVKTQRVKMVSIPDLTDPQAPNKSMPQYKEGKSEQEYIEASSKFLTDEVIIEI